MFPLIVTFLLVILQSLGPEYPKQNRKSLIIVVCFSVIGNNRSRKCVCELNEQVRSRCLSVSCV
jgi:hypothetical protein